MVLDEELTDEWIQVLNLLHDAYTELDHRRYKPDKGGYTPIYHLTLFAGEKAKLEFTDASQFMYGETKSVYREDDSYSEFRELPF